MGFPSLENDGHLDPAVIHLRLPLKYIAHICYLYILRTHDLQFYLCVYLTHMSVYIPYACITSKLGRSDINHSRMQAQKYI